MIGGLGRFLLRKGLLYVALVCAIGIAPIVSKLAIDAWHSWQNRKQEYAILASAVTQLETEAKRLQQGIANPKTLIRQKSSGEIEGLLKANLEALTLDEARLKKSDFISLATYRNGAANTFVEQQKVNLHLAYLRRERAALLVAKVNLATAEELVAAQRACGSAQAELTSLEQRWTYQLRSFVESDGHKALAEKSKRACERAEVAKASRRKSIALIQSIDRLPYLGKTLGNLRQASANSLKELNASWFEWLKIQAEKWRVSDLLMKAFWAFLAVILGP